MGKQSQKNQGSALLIVLGFLSFMMISAVSFAVYMRIERQASSNYRHASTSRHLLNTALTRAMDEIDSELRITGYNDSNRKYSDGSVPPNKFPTNWVGRVRCSACANGANNANNARVLSLDALAYLPAILVNDVRRYAIPNERDTNDSGSEFGDATTQNSQGDTIYEYNSAENWRGAKWRPIRQPLGAFEGENNANTKPEIGRYAYVCVNLSDMLNINQCRAYIGNCNSGTNRISVGHLFDSTVKQKKFDENYVNQDRYYENMADFYACMSSSGRGSQDSPFVSGADGAPYQYWVGQWKNPDQSNPDKYFGGTSSKRYAEKHVVVTDGIVKPEPRAVQDGLTPVNLKTDSPFKSTVNLATRATPGSSRFSTFQLTDAYFNALKASLTDENLDAPSRYLFGAMLADYLDTDDLPRFLCTPCMERVPQLNRIFLNNKDFWTLDISQTSRDEGDQQVTLTWTISSKLAKNLKFLTVQSLFPFHMDDRDTGKSFSVEIDAGFYVTLEGALNHKLSATQGNKKGDKVGFASRTSDLMTGKIVLSTGYYGNNRPMFEGADPSSITYTKTVDKGGDESFPNDLTAKFQVVLVAKIKDKSGEIVDAVPMTFDEINRWQGALGEDTMSKLSFSGTIPNLKMGENRGVQWDFSNFECPDPRYNWRVGNWLADNNTASPVSGTTALAAAATLAAQMHGLDGRDGDFYQMSKNTGDGFLQSPGEWGFFPRAVSIGTWYNQGSSDDIRTSLANLINYNVMCRTFRLYDHGTSHGRDHVYRYFYSANTDGSLDGPRVNPFSDLNLVLSAAISATPEDYYWAAQSSALRSEHCIFNKDASTQSSLDLSENDWKGITNGWFQCLQVARNTTLSSYSSRMKLNPKTGETVGNSYRFNLSDIYGECKLFNWYTDGSASTIFKGTQYSQSLSRNLSESCRKMLYAYTLDNFSDRQQLFLYILYAETVVPSLGGASDVGVKSLAGGRAVALVWRDPYPEGYKKTVNGTSITESWMTPSDLYKGDREGSSEDSLHRYSPWYQYSRNKQRGEYDDERDEFGTTSSERHDAGIVRESTSYQNGGYHEQRVLFFKVLDN